MHVKRNRLANEISYPAQPHLNGRLIPRLPLLGFTVISFLLRRHKICSKGVTRDTPGKCHSRLLFVHVCACALFFLFFPSLRVFRPGRLCLLCVQQVVSLLLEERRGEEGEGSFSTCHVRRRDLINSLTQEGDPTVFGLLNPLS